MSGSIRVPSILALATLCASSAALASLGVSPQNCTVPAAIRLVGSLAGVPDASTGRFAIVVRDLANTPRSGASVVIDLSGCPDFTICGNQLDAEATVNCAAKTVRKFTGVDGGVTFTILGGSIGANNATTISGAGGPFRIYANGIPITQPTISAYDLDGSGGLGADDLSTWLSDFATGLPYARSDYDGNGIISANDLSHWLEVFAAGKSVESCSAACP